MGCGLWVVGCGLWAVGCGLWVTGCGTVARVTTRADATAPAADVGSDVVGVTPARPMFDGSEIGRRGWMDECMDGR